MPMRLYLDNNIYAHAQQVGQEADLRDWLRQEGHRAVLSDTLLGETIRISDPTMRMQRLQLLADLPSVRACCLGELQAREFVNEVRRLRSDWRRLPVGDETAINRMRAARKKGWGWLGRDSERLAQETGGYSEVEERGIHGARAGQQTIRGDILAERTRVEDLQLGSVRFPIRRLNLDDEDDSAGWSPCSPGIRRCPKAWRP